MRIWVWVLAPTSNPGASITPVLRRQRERLPRAHCPASLVSQWNSGTVEDPTSKKGCWVENNQDSCRQPLPSIHTCPRGRGEYVTGEPQSYPCPPNISFFKWCCAQAGEMAHRLRGLRAHTALAEDLDLLLLLHTHTYTEKHTPHTHKN